MRLSDQQLERLKANFREVDDQPGYGDGQYVLHELAHFVTMFRRAPKMTRSEFRDMNEVLDALPCGIAQVHELRTLKLQYDVLGKKFPAPDLKQVWFGIEDVVYERQRGGRSVITSKADARRRLNTIKVSPRLVRAYELAIKRFS